MQSKLRSAEKIETPQGSCDTWQALWGPALTSYFCFSLQCLEVLSRTLLKSCPEHRPLWLLLTLLSSKDHRAVLCLCGQMALLRVPWMVTCTLTPPLSPPERCGARWGMDMTRRNSLSGAFLTGGGSRGTGPDSIFYGLQDIARFLASEPGL